MFVKFLLVQGGCGIVNTDHIVAVVMDKRPPAALQIQFIDGLKINLDPNYDIDEVLKYLNGATDDDA